MGPYEHSAKLQGVEAWLIRKNLTTNMFIIGVKIKDYPTKELELPMSSIKSLDDVYKYVIGKYL